MLRKQIVSLPHKMHQIFNPKPNYTNIFTVNKIMLHFAPPKFAENGATPHAASLRGYYIRH